jgi:hypothetical protein
MVLFIDAQKIAEMIMIKDSFFPPMAYLAAP